MTTEEHRNFEGKVALDIDNYFWRGAPLPDYLAPYAEMINAAGADAHELADGGDDPDDSMDEETFDYLLDKVEEDYVEAVLAMMAKDGQQ